MHSLVCRGTAELQIGVLGVSCTNSKNKSATEPRFNATDLSESECQNTI